MGIRQDREYYVYILCNQKNGALYTGMTNDLGARVLEHKEKKAPKSYTAQKNISRLVYFEAFDTPGEAIDREKFVKKKTRAYRVKLIETKNPDWSELYYRLGELLY
ncbi:GIY-YIG nuclease family protein [Litorimonas sp.]|uniref:GIY-YIG nuclease family protein n=1 Tax=Litorimonas sp. TaxID=1892381 RepID=UPI003A878F9B